MKPPYTIHARLHLFHRRRREAAHWAERGLGLARRRLRSDGNGPSGQSYWQAFWFGSVIAQAAQMAHSGRPAGLRRAVRLLREWLPAIAPGDAHREWGQSEMAVYLGRLGQADAAIAVSQTAIRQAELNRPLEHHFRLRDHARLLADVGRPAQALAVLEQSRVRVQGEPPSVDSVTRRELIEAECLFALGDRAGASLRLRAAEQAIRSHSLHYLEADFKNVLAHC